MCDLSLSGSSPVVAIFLLHSDLPRFEVSLLQTEHSAIHAVLHFLFAFGKVCLQNVIRNGDSFWFDVPVNEFLDNRHSSKNRV